VQECLTGVASPGLKEYYARKSLAFKIFVTVDSVLGHLVNLNHYHQYKMRFVLLIIISLPQWTRVQQQQRRVLPASKNILHLIRATDRPDKCPQLQLT
jgi:hypothetical protein